MTRRFILIGLTALLTLSLPAIPRLGFFPATTIEFVRIEASGVVHAQDAVKEATPDQAQSTIQQLVQALNEAQQTSQAQAKALVEKQTALQQLQQQQGAMLAAVDKAGKTFASEGQTLVLKDKPAAPSAAVAPAKAPEKK